VRVAVVPARNEGRHILGVLASLKHFVDLTLVVDDASEDETDEIAIGSGCVVIRNESHAGYGASIRKGLEWCWKNGASVVVTIDGDGQHKGEWIKKGILLLEDGADVVLANRFSSLEGIPQTKLLSNNFAWSCVKKILRKPPACRDVSCGFRIYGRRSLVPTLETPKKVTSGYAFTQSTCTELHRADLRLSVLNVPAIYPENVLGTAASELHDFLLWLVQCTPLHPEARGWLEDLESGARLTLEFDGWQTEDRLIRAVAKPVDGFLRFSEA